MTILKRSCAVLVVLLVFGGGAATAQQPPPQQQGEFIPIDQLPPQEQMAAAPLLIGAYSFVLAVLFLYLVSVARRLTSVQGEIERLETSLKQSGKA
jgi:CcmD family protein